MDGFSGLGDGSGFDGGINPAWNEALEHIPDDVRDNVLPVFKKWDDNFQGQVQKVHSEYEPYKEFKEGNVAPDDIRMALGIAQALSDNPRQVWETMANSYGWETGGASGGAGNSSETGQGSSEQNVQNQGAQNNSGAGFELPDSVREQLNKLQTGQETMAQIILQKQQEEQQKLEDAQLQEQIADLKKQHGNFHEGFVLSQMHLGVSGEDAIKAYNSMIQEAMTERNRPQAPRLLAGGNGSGIPGERRMDPAKMSTGEVNAEVANYLCAAKAANQ